jgi:cerevisin
MWPSVKSLIIMVRLAAFVCILFSIAAQAIVQLPPPPSRSQLAFTYIVRFADNVPSNVRDAHINWIKDLESNRKDVKLRHIFSQTFDGYSAVLDHDSLEEVRYKNEIVAIDYVGLSAQRERFPEHTIDTVESEQTVVNLDAPTHDRNPVQGLVSINDRGWNANRISHRNFTTGYQNGPWVHDGNLGKGVTVYVLDTGVKLDRPGFKGSNVSFGVNVVHDTPDDDLDGHGTMCAGVISGEKYGLSPEARLISVKVSSIVTHTETDHLVAGIEWVLAQPGENNMKVISMSQYGLWTLFNISASVEDAVNKGVHVVGCAGNDNVDSCNFEPARSRGVITVGSVNAFNQLPVKGTLEESFVQPKQENESTNTGKCVTIFAPGSWVPSIWNHDDPHYGFRGWGTSIATPQVAALVANRLSQVGAQTPAQIKKWLQDTATKGQIEGDLKGAPNLIAYNGLGE